MRVCVYYLNVKRIIFENEENLKRRIVPMYRGKYTDSRRVG